MDPIQSWLDAKEVRRMAESLMAPAPEVDQSAVDAGYGDDFEGFADAKVAEKSEPEPPNSPVTEDQESAKPRFTPVTREVQTQPEPSAPIVEKAEPEEVVKEDSPTEGVGTSARIVVSHALADAKRMAEGSGMLASDTEPPKPSADESEDVPETALQPEAPVETASLSPQISSPFQLCDDQSSDEDVPIARQLDSVEKSTSETEDELPEAPAEVTPEPIEKSVVATSEPVAEQEEPREKVVLPPAPTRPSFAKPTSGAARGPFLTRLKGFSGQLRDRLGAKAMFLIDSEGQILIDEVGNTKLIQVARTLANASNTASRQSEGSADVGNLHVKIGASATLEVIPCRSRYGLLILGVVCPAPLGALRVKQVAEHLAKTVEPEGGV